MKHNIFLIIFLITYNIQTVECQIIDNNLDKIIIAFKNNDLNNVKKYLDKESDQKIKNIFLKLYKNNKTGAKYHLNKLDLNLFSGRKLTIVRYLIAEHTFKKNSKTDLLIFNLYRESYHDALKTNDTLVLNEVLNRINWFLYKSQFNLEEFKKYLNLYKIFSKDKIDTFYVKFYEIAHEMNKIDIEKIIIDTIWFKKKFKEIYNETNNHFLIGKLKNFEGIFYSAYINEKILAKKAYKEAINHFSIDSSYYSRHKINGLEFNFAIDYFEEKKYKKAISNFLKILKKEKDSIYLMYGYNWLRKCYDSLENHKKAYYYFNKMIKVKTNLNQLRYARDIKYIEKKYDFKEKQKIYVNVIKQNKVLESNQITNLIILSILSFILAIVFILYKKHHKKSKILEEEKSETIKKIDELKEIVIKNHIVLKDKTKVYIADLLYIKSDDHYLKIFLSNGKNHFVRGRLNKIIEELPPNFIRCHRSYVVNRNFIKQINNNNIILTDKTEIPLSRTFKNQL